MTVGWRSPLGGPRYNGPQSPEDPRVDEWREAEIEKELRIRKEARAVAGPEGEDALRTDGGDDSNCHTEGVNQALREAEGDDDLENPPLHVGDHVRDREDEDGATMLVVATPPLRANACKIGDGPLTVADVNDDYPDDERVVKVVYPERTDVSTRPLERYAFPRGRLELVAPIHDRDGGEE